MTNRQRLETAIALAKPLARYPYWLHPAAPVPPAGPSSLAAPTQAARPPVAASEREGTAFTRLAVVHSLSSCGDAIVAVALAGSIFFDVSVHAAQSRVALSLALTVAPFAIVGPLLGPLVERARAGRRAVVVSSAAGRAICCFLMAFWAHSLALFPVAFFTLVFSKLYLVTRAALVPGVVERPEELVLANSKLSVGGSMAGTVAGGLGAALLNLLGSPLLLRLDMLAYLACAWGASRLIGVSPPAAAGAQTVPGVETIPGAQPGPGPQAVTGPSALRLPPGGLQLAALATAGLRSCTGFVTFLLVFTFRRNSAALIWYGLALGASQVGNVAGALLAPRLRQRAPEEWMLTASCVVVGATSLAIGLINWGRHWALAVVLGAGVGLAAGSAKLAFDSMVQRDVPSRARSRAFARFESGFQLTWAVGSLIAVLVPMSLSAGFVAIGTIGLLGAASFAGGSVKARRGTLPAWFPGSAPRPVRPGPASSSPGKLKP